jgi:mannose-1-phosphate guanylyltransferase
LRALLLAAGLGTRLRPLTDSVPKCLVEIGGRPLLDYWIELLSQGGVTDALVNLHHLPDAVREYVAGCKYPLNIATVFEEQLLGTAGTLRKNRAFFGNGPAMLVHADNLSFFDLPAFMERFAGRPAGIEMTMMTFRTDAPESCGIVELDGRGVVRAFHEKVKNPPGDLANAAVYILAPSVLDFVAGLGEEVSDFSTGVLPHYVGRMNTFHNNVYHRDIGTLASLAAAREEIMVLARKGRPPASHPQGHHGD